jgi:hypothetical protein
MADYTKVFDADNMAEAELIREALEEAQIDARIEDQVSPLDGLTAMGQGTPIYVPADQLAQAEEVIDKFVDESSATDDEEE